MRKAIFYLCVVVFFILCLIHVACADELSELKAQMKAVQKQMEEMQKKIEKLEAEKAARVETPEDVADRIVAIEKKLEEPYKGGLLSLKGEKWELGGVFEACFVDAYRRKSVSKPEPHFQFDMLGLKPKVSITDDIYFEGWIELYTNSILAKSVYAHFGDLPFDSYLRIGADQRFMKPSRKTKRYPLAGNAFWRDHPVGIHAGGEFNPVYWRFSYTNGLEINQNAITDDSSLLMLHDNLKTSSYTKFGEIGTGLGLKHDFGEIGEIDTLGFFFLSKLSEADEVFLRSNLTGYDSTRRNQYRYGANLNYSLADANLFAHFIVGEDGELDRYAWYIQPSYKLNLAEAFDKSQWKYFYAIEPLFRYGRLYIDNIAAAPHDSLTWDREELTFAILTDIYENIKLRSEYTIDRMDKGDETESYSELLMQLQIYF